MPYINKKYFSDIITKTHALLTVEEGKLLYELAKNGPSNGVIVEIGSYKGGSTIMLALGSKVAHREKIYAVDPHKNYDMMLGWVGKEKIPQSTLGIFKRNIKDLKVTDQVIPLVGLSSEMAKGWKLPIRLLWIDGDHAYFRVKEDFLLWERYLTKGGIIALHDTKNSENMSPITKDIIRKNDGPAKVAEESVLFLKRFSNVKTVDSITIAQKNASASYLESFRENLIMHTTNFLDLADIYIGRLDLKIRKLTPKIYRVIKLLKGKKDSLMYTVEPYTMVGRARLNKLYELSSAAERDRLEGCFVECGVWNGGSAGIMAYNARGNNNREAWLFDSWEGLPKPGKHDVNCQGEILKKGACLGSLSEVEELFFKKLKLDRKRNHLIKGFFEKTFKNYRKNIKHIAILHIDCDFYEPVKLCLNEFYDKVVPGGYVVIDDYGYWKGCRKAVNEFIKKRGLNIKLNEIDAAGVYFKK